LSGLDSYKLRISTLKNVSCADKSHLVNEEANQSARVSIGFLFLFLLLLISHWYVAAFASLAVDVVAVVAAAVFVGAVDDVVGNGPARSLLCTSHLVQ
jgi:hypothetical protein